MSDNQLKVLLENYSRRVDEMISMIECEYPELQEEYKTIAGTFKRIKAIDPLREFLSDLEDDIETLNS